MPVAGGDVEPIAGGQLAANQRHDFALVAHVVRERLFDRPRIDRVFSQRVLLAAGRLNDEDFFGVVMPPEAELSAGRAVHMDVDWRGEVTGKGGGYVGQSRVVSLSMTDEERIAIADQSLRLVFG